jgi:hypothetical protein
MTSACIALSNGLGDKMLDMLGFFVICKYLNYEPYVRFNNKPIRYFPWGNDQYDLRLFDFRHINFIENSCDFFIESPNPSVSLCPYKVYEFLKTIRPDIDFLEISNDYVKYAKEIINPSREIINNIPNNAEKAYGIHLRKSDKIQPFSNGHENTISEFDIIISKLLENIGIIIDKEEEPLFLIVSEDIIWKEEITNKIKTIGLSKSKHVEFLSIDYTNINNYDNFSSILDMFSLAKCKEIIQGVKYSSFSILASIIGNGKISNFARFLHPESEYNSIIYNWNSVVEINDKKISEAEFYKNFTVCIPLVTNIKLD